MSAHGMGDLKTVSALALHAGVDMDMVGEGYLTTLQQSLNEGKVSMEEINESCRRVLEMKYKLGLFDDPYRYISNSRMKTEIFTDEHKKVARELARESVVLLKNDDHILPLKKSGTIAVIGPLGDSKNDMLGSWVVAGNRDEVSTLKSGLEKAGEGNVKILYAKGSDLTLDPYMIKTIRSPRDRNQNESPAVSPDELIKEALAVAQKADVIVAAVGESAGWSGEAASRSDISIPECQQRLLEALKETGKPVVVVAFSGRPLVLSWENERFSTIVEAWQGGTEGGDALADILFGDYTPSGKLTMSFPRSTGQIPVYYNCLNTGRPFDLNNRFTSKYLDIPNDPLFPFGYGLSYTTFEYSPIELSDKNPKGDTKITASVVVTNTGNYAGTETVQLYIADPVASISRPLKELKGFQRVMLKPGESKKVSFEIGTGDLKFYNSKLDYTREPGEFYVYVGTNSSNAESASIDWE